MYIKLNKNAPHRIIHAPILLIHHFWIISKKDKNKQNFIIFFYTKYCISQLQQLIYGTWQLIVHNYKKGLTKTA